MKMLLFFFSLQWASGFILQSLYSNYCHINPSVQTLFSLFYYEATKYKTNETKPDKKVLHLWVFSGESVSLPAKMHLILYIVVQRNHFEIV